MLVPIVPAPGVNKDDTTLAAAGGYTDAQWVRFVRGLPEKMGGWEPAASGQTLEGTPRSAFAWADNSGVSCAALGTHSRLYVYSAGKLYNITPIRSSATLGADPIVTTAGSSTVTITHSTHGAITGDSVYVTAASAVSGVTVGGASGTMSAGAFTTFTGSKAVVVTHTAHGLASNNIATFASASAVGGITISGDYNAEVSDANTYIIYHGTAATSDATGGGTPTYEYYKPHTLTPVDANSYTITGTGTAAATTTGGGSAVKVKYEISVGYQFGATSGYGSGYYGEGNYGIIVPGDYYVRTWSMDNWGEFLVANPRGGTVYEWQLGLSARAAAISNAPAKIVSIMVTPERVLVAMGCTSAGGTFDPLLVRNSDIADNTVWTETVANSARAYRLATGSRIVNGAVSRGQNLIWTDTGLYAQRFDAQDVYAYDLIGSGCGLLGQNAFIVKEGLALWWASAKQFYAYAGGDPSAVPCPVRDFVFNNLSEGQEDKVSGSINTKFNEAWFLYPTGDDSENNRYLVVSLDMLGSSPLQAWNTGTIDRTVLADGKTLLYPVAASSVGEVYFQEVGQSDENGVGIASSVTTAYSDIRSGEVHMDIFRMIPDFVFDSGVTGSLTFYAKEFPSTSVSTDGPYTISETSDQIDVRTGGRQAAWNFASSSAGFWRLGKMRIDVMEAGRR